MIHPRFKDCVETETVGAGFRKETTFICRSGQHHMFETLGKLLIDYSSGKRCWNVRLATAWKRHYFANHIEDEFRTVSTHKTYVEAYQTACANIDNFYIQLEATPETEPAG